MTACVPDDDSLSFYKGRPDIKLASASLFKINRIDNEAEVTSNAVHNNLKSDTTCLLIWQLVHFDVLFFSLLWHNLVLHISFLGLLSPNPSNNCVILQRFLHETIQGSTSSSATVNSSVYWYWAHLNYSSFFIQQIQKQKKTSSFVTMVIPKLFVSCLVWILMFRALIAWWAFKCNHMHNLHVGTLRVSSIPLKHKRIAIHINMAFSLLVY